MNLLFLTQLLPYPPYTGGKYKTFSILKLLAKSHQIHLVTFHTQKIDQLQIKKLESLLNIKVKSFYNPIVTAPSKKIKLVALKSLFSRKPFRIYKYFDTQLANYLKKLTTKKSFDCIYFDHNTSIQYLPFINKKSKSITIYDEHNLNSLAMLRMAKVPRKNFIMCFFLLLDSLKNFFYEKWLVKQIDFIFAISNHDRKLLIKRGANRKTTHTLPVPFTTKSKFKYQSISPTIIIVGLMSWAPNKIGIFWFIKHIYPIIKKSIPNLKLLLIGAKPDINILKLQKDTSIQVTGEVSSLKPYYRQANLLVAPILQGSGIRIKILHALAAGIPIVSTQIGAEGIQPKINNGILTTSNRPQIMAQKIIKVIKTKKISNQLSSQGVNFINQNYSPKNTKKILQSFNL